MPLNWNVKNCKDWESLVEGDEYAATEVLVFALGMLGCGGVVTDKNAPEIYARLAMYEAADGALRSRLVDGKREPVYFTPAEIEARLGLYTNWGSRKESRAVWIKRVLSAEQARGIAAKAVEYRNATSKVAVA